jgi:hypothetical protein
MHEKEIDKDFKVKRTRNDLMANQKPTKSIPAEKGRGRKPTSPQKKKQGRKRKEKDGRKAGKAAGNSLIADLLNLKQPTPGTDIRLA